MEYVTSTAIIYTQDKIHSLLVNKVTCRENKVGEKGGKGFGCLSKKKMNACYPAEIISAAEFFKQVLLINSACENISAG